MPRLRPTLIILSLTALVAAGCTEAQPADEPAVPAPATTGGPDTGAPDEPAATDDVPETLAFTARTVDGGELDAATLAGQPVAFWFWAAWCPRCAAAAGDVAEVAAEYAGRAHVVGVAGLGSGEDSMRQFVDRHGLTGFPQLADDDGEVWQRFGVTTQEYFVLLDDQGEVVHEGPLGAGAVREQLAGLTG